MTPTCQLYQGDCRALLAQMPEGSVDAVVTDPPYELAFMGRAWDATGVAFDVETWRHAYRVLKPGGHLLAFGGTRTYHRLACAIEDAGFEIRDSIMWIYGSGFPKSHDVSKAIDKAAGAEREVLSSFARQGRSGGILGQKTAIIREITSPSTSEAQEWAGWGTALKPAHEPIVVARKPLIGTVAANVLRYGTGGMNIDECRVGDEVICNHGGGRNDVARIYGGGSGIPSIEAGSNPRIGRWPANLIHDGLSEPWARFFYCAKASKADRGAGNTHPTVKPQALMQYLCRLVTPPNGVVLDPFMGSGSTGKAALIEGFSFIGIELDLAHFEGGKIRLESSLAEKSRGN